MKLSDWPLDTVRIVCKRCGRDGKLRWETLADRFGEDADMFSIRADLSEPTCKRENRAEPCGAILADALLVQAMLAESDDQVIKPDLIPEAEKLRKELGLQRA